MGVQRVKVGCWVLGAGCLLARLGAGTDSRRSSTMPLPNPLGPANVLATAGTSRPA